MEEAQGSTPGVVPGAQTTEYKLTNRASWAGIAMLILGAVVEVADALVQALTPIAAQFPDLKWLGAALLVAGTIVKVGTVVGYQRSRALVKGAAASVRALAVLLALGLAAPAFAQVSELGTDDPGTAIASAVAESTPDFRGGTYLEWLPGAPALVPAVAISPFALSLRDGAVTSGITVGAGYELLWHATEPTARGVAVYANMRSTADGPRALVSVLGIVTPYLGAGIGYQVGGGASSFRDAAVLLVSVGTNLGLASR